MYGMSSLNADYQKCSHFLSLCYLKVEICNASTMYLCITGFSSTKNKRETTSKTAIYYNEFARCLFAKIIDEILLFILI